MRADAYYAPAFIDGVAHILTEPRLYSDTQLKAAREQALAITRQGANVGALIYLAKAGILSDERRGYAEALGETDVSAYRRPAAVDIENENRHMRDSRNQKEGI